MRILFSSLSLALVLAIFSSCGPTVPTELEIRDKLLGRYCADKYLLVIEDSTYRCRKLNLGVISSSLIPESCKGSYELVLENDSWVIHFNKDPRPQGIQNCKRDFVIWNKEKQYLIESNNKTIMWDLFDEQMLTKGLCE